MSIKATLDGLYERSSGMYGGGWTSYEKGVRVGDVRVINETLCHAWQIYRATFPWRKDKVLWSSLDPKAIRKVDITERVQV